MLSSPASARVEREEKGGTRVFPPMLEVVVYVAEPDPALNVLVSTSSFARER